LIPHLDIPRKSERFKILSAFVNGKKRKKYLPSVAEIDKFNFGSFVKSYIMLLRGTVTENNLSIISKDYVI
jgi:hypothetical protein